MALKSFSISFLVFLIALQTAVAGLPVDFSGEFEVPALLDSSALKFDFAVPSNIRPVLFRGADWRGKPSRVFAWYGVPTTGKAPYPAVVLVHGGGGSAFSEWVKRWNERGFAAIAVDTHGYIPTSPWEGMKISKPLEGGANATRFAPGDAVRDQWTYQAVSAVIRAHSLLRSFPEIDKNNIGITGISWGGYLTLITAGVDSRFKYAIPVYGCGFLDDPMSSTVTPLSAMDAAARKRWFELWNPSNYCGNAKMPVFMITDCDDAAYPLEHWLRTQKLLKNAPALFFDHTFGHSHQSGDRPEVLRFARAMTGVATMPATVVSLKNAGGKVELNFKGGKAPFQAHLIYTTEPLPVNEKFYMGKPYINGKVRKWQTLPVTVKDGKITTQIPAEAVFSFIRLTDDEGPVSFLLK